MVQKLTAKKKQKTGSALKMHGRRAKHKKTKNTLSELCGYNQVWLLHRPTDTAHLLEVQAQACPELNSPLHVSAARQAVKDGVYHYEWSKTARGKTRLYQTTCVALPRLDSKEGAVLAFSRDITQIALPYYPAGTTLKDDLAPRTFAQILLATRETEKKEISKALHDEIGSSAVMLTALLSLVKANVKEGNQKQTLRDLEQLDEQLKASVERLKNLIVSLRPPALENKGGLGGAVRDLLENISALGHLSYTFDYDAIDEQICLSDKVKILLYRIVQEALTNTVKHAHAKHIRVCLKRVRMNIRLEIMDDGIGFEPAQQRSIEHVGLLAMRDSVELLGGTISVKSAPGKGTHITVVCPCVTYGGKIE